MGFDLEQAGIYQIAFGVVEAGNSNGYNPHFKIDNIRWSAGNEPIPEPSTYGLIGAGFLGVLIGLRRFRRKKRGEALRR